MENELIWRWSEEEGRGPCQCRVRPAQAATRSHAVCMLCTGRPLARLRPPTHSVAPSSEFAHLVAQQLRDELHRDNDEAQTKQDAGLREEGGWVGGRAGGAQWEGQLRKHAWGAACIHVHVQPARLPCSNLPRSPPTDRS